MTPPEEKFFLMEKRERDEVREENDKEEKEKLALSPSSVFR